MEYRNPFAIMDGQLITVSDLKGNKGRQNGILTCPACHEPMTLKTDKDNHSYFEHHTPDYGDRYAIVKGFMLLVEEMVNSGYAITLPPLIVGFDKDGYLPRDKEVLETLIEYLPRLADPSCQVRLQDKMEYEFDQAKPVKEQEGNLLTLLLHMKKSVLAFRVSLYQERRLGKETLPYMDLSTIALNLEPYLQVFLACRKEEIMDMLSKGRFDLRWVRSQRVKEIGDELLMKSILLLEERVRKTPDGSEGDCHIIRVAETREIWQGRKLSKDSSALKELGKKMEELEGFIVRRKVKPESSDPLAKVQIWTGKSVPNLNQKNVQKEGGRVFSDESMGTIDFDRAERIIDTKGIRWIRCNLCGKIMTEDNFAVYGGPGSVNYGKCERCWGKEE